MLARPFATLPLSHAAHRSLRRRSFAPGASEHYTGNVGTSQGFEVKPDAKLTTEIDISHSPRAIWDGVDFALLQALLGAIHTYMPRAAHTLPCSDVHMHALPS